MGDYQKKKGKSPWRFVFQAMAVYGAVKLLGGICVNVLHLLTRTQMMLSDSQAYSVGIIGGADGPTAVLVMNEPKPRRYTGSFFSSDALTSSIKASTIV